ncbi:MAG: hypothetical protein AB7U43_08865, partial [Desulfobacter sp.]
FTLLAESNRLLPEKFLLLWAELACVCIHAGIISDINYRRVNNSEIPSRARMKLETLGLTLCATVFEVVCKYREWRAGI